MCKMSKRRNWGAKGLGSCNQRNSWERHIIKANWGKESGREWKENRSFLLLTTPRGKGHKKKKRTKCLKYIWRLRKGRKGRGKGEWEIKGNEWIENQTGNSSEGDGEEGQQLRFKEQLGRCKGSCFTLLHASTRTAAAGVKHAPFQNTQEKRTRTPCETKYPPMSSQVSNTEICMVI